MSEFNWLLGKYHQKGGEGSGWYAPPKGSHTSREVTSAQRGEVLRQLKSRVEWMRGKININWVEPVKEPKQTQRIHILASVETTAATAKRWGVDDLPELLRHPHSSGNMSMRIGKPIRKRGEPPVVVKFDW